MKVLFIRRSARHLLMSLIATGMASSLAFSAEYSTSSLWSATAKRDSTDLAADARGPEQRSLRADPQQLEDILAAAPARELQQEGVLVDLPLPNGNFVRFRLFGDSILPPDLARKYPSIKTYSGYLESDPSIRGRFDMTEQGFHGMFTYQGEIILIDPENNTDTGAYVTFKKSGARKANNFKDAVRSRPAAANDEPQARDAFNRPAQPDGKIRTYRLAVATTGEYTKFAGGTKAKGLSAVVTAINRVNQVYESDFSIRLNLVSNQDAVIYTNSSSDPYKNNGNDGLLNTANLNKVIGTSNYDIGHIFVTSSGGVAALGSVCGKEKADGLTGSANPIGDPFYIDYVAHEMGHQFNALHTFNTNNSECGSGNRDASAAYEPGSGSTIMGYTGICGEEDLQKNSDPYFHSHSISEVNKFVTSGAGKNCGTQSNSSNQAPNADAGNDYMIPAQTPFMLTGSATDPDAGDNNLLTYVWEEYDLGTASTSKASMVDNGSRPIFRSFLPTKSPVRYFPKLNDLLNGTSTIGMAMPTTTRKLNFRLTVRDTKGGVSIDDMLVNVTKTNGAFKTTAPTTSTQAIMGQSISVRWNVAQTDISPINCVKVNISISFNEAQSFLTIGNDLPNNGSANVNAPFTNFGDARIKVSCSDNIFFALSPKFKVVVSDVSSASRSSSSVAISSVAPSSVAVSSVAPSSTAATSSSASSSVPAGNCINYTDGNRTDVDLSATTCVKVSVNLSGKTLQVWDSESNASCDFRGTVTSVDGTGSLAVTSNYVSGSGFTGTTLNFATNNNCKFVRLRTF